jgi:ribonuclease E
MATKATTTSPDRMRAHQLAKELGITSKALIARVAAEGVDVKSPQSSVPAEIVARLRAETGPTADPADTAAAVTGGGRRGAPPVLFVSPPEPPRGAPAVLDVVSGLAEAEPDDVREAAIEEATGARRRRRRGRRGRGGRAAATDTTDDGENQPAEPVTSAPAAPAAKRQASRAKKATAPSPAGDDTASDTAGDTASDSAGDTVEDTFGQTAAQAAGQGAAETEADTVEETPGEGGSTRRRRRRRRSTAGGSGPDLGEDDPENTVVHVRAPRPKTEDDGVRGVKGSTRLEAKRQRRRDGRESGRRRPPILTEAEFLARRESVDRVMAVRQHGSRTQIAVLEDDVLVEHYVTQASTSSYVGNIYLGRVQNVLPSMEAAFVDIGKGRNGVLYAGEVNWDAAGLEGKSRAIEGALKSGDTVLVQVTKDPIGHKGARLTSQISLPGRYLVYVPRGAMTGISRKLPDTERHRLKAILKKVVPEDAGVIIRTAAEGASEEDITRDVERLTKLWETIEKTAAKAKTAPVIVHAEADLAVRVVRDVFNEDFTKLVVQGDGAWKTICDYVDSVAPELAPRLGKHTGTGDVFHDLRIDEQLMKGLDRKVWLPSGGSLVIDRTEAMTVIDVNTGKFVGAGGNLEETVTRNNLEAAEEIVRQLRLRDIGGIIVIDFIDMVLESNRELVLRRLTECLGRDRTKHQVAEVTSLGLVQMTRKRVGEGLLEAFSEPCTVCHGRGVIVHTEPVERAGAGVADEAEEKAPGKRRRGPRKAEGEPAEPPITEEQRQARLAAINAIHRAAHGDEPDTAELGSGEPQSVDDAEAELEMAAVATALDAAPAGSDAAESYPSAAELVDAEPVEAEVVDAELVEAEVVDAEPVEADVVDAELVEAVPIDAEVLEAELLDAQPVDAEVVDAEPIDVAVVDADPVEAEVVDAEPVDAVTVDADVLIPRAAPPRRRRRAATRPAGPPVAAQG